MSVWQPPQLRGLLAVGGRDICARAATPPARGGHPRESAERRHTVAEHAREPSDLLLRAVTHRLRGWSSLRRAGTPPGPTSHYGAVSQADGQGRSGQPGHRRRQDTPRGDPAAAVTLPGAGHGRARSRAVRHGTVSVRPTRRSFPARTLSSRTSANRRAPCRVALVRAHPGAASQPDRQWRSCRSAGAEADPGRRADFEALVHPIFAFLNTTPHRVPMTDWYWTHEPTKVGFQARSVVGGVFLRLLYEPAVWKKWGSRDEDEGRGMRRAAPGPG